MGAPGWIGRRRVRRAASLNRPFYAGLAAYGYAIHYASNGARLAVLGDLDPALVGSRRELQFMAIITI